jgi:hypothetical protein
VGTDAVPEGKNGSSTLFIVPPTNNKEGETDQTSARFAKHQKRQNKLEAEHRKLVKEYKEKIKEITSKTEKTQELTHLGFIVLIVTVAGMVSAGFFSFIEIFGEGKASTSVFVVPVRGAPLCPLR